MKAMDKELRFCFHTTVSKTSPYPCFHWTDLWGGGGLYKSHMTTSETEAQTTQRQYWATSTRIENTMDREIGILGGTHPAER